MWLFKEANDIYEIDKTAGTFSITIMLTLAASGTVTPSMLFSLFIENDAPASIAETVCR